jgi:hypothetical protein
MYSPRYWYQNFCPSVKSWFWFLCRLFFFFFGQRFPNPSRLKAAVLSPPSPLHQRSHPRTKDAHISKGTDGLLTQPPSKCRFFSSVPHLNKTTNPCQQRNSTATSALIVTPALVHPLLLFLSSYIVLSLVTHPPPAPTEHHRLFVKSWIVAATVASRNGNGDWRNKTFCLWVQFILQLTRNRTGSSSASDYLTGSSW